MNEKIVEMVLQLAEQGGHTALWLYGIYVFGAVAKFCIGFGCFVIATYKFCGTWKEIKNG